MLVEFIQTQAKLYRVKRTFLRHLRQVINGGLILLNRIWQPVFSDGNLSLNGVQAVIIGIDFFGSIQKTTCNVQLPQAHIRLSGTQRIADISFGPFDGLAVRIGRFLFIAA